MPDAITKAGKKESGNNSSNPAPNENSISNVKWVGLLSGLVVFFLMVFSSPPEGLSLEGWRTAAVALLMATWWVSEVIPIPATAMVPLVLFPVLGIADIGAAAAPYANPMIFLFLGGFIIAIAMQEWNLHRRIALNIINVVGSSPRNIIAGFMISTAFISMWISNTAAAMMMLPIALSVIELTRNAGRNNEDKAQYRNFAMVLMLIIAYAASIGGLGTVIGSPTNALLIGFVDEAYGVEISFLQWMMIGVPVTLFGLPVMFYVLANIAYPCSIKTLPGGKEFIRSELANLGKINRPEAIVAGIFAMVAVLWMTRPLLSSYVPGLSDTSIAIFGALLLFMIPINLRSGQFILSWKAAEKLPWGVLILFGGGLTLAGAIHQTGLAEWIGGYFAVIGGWPVILVIFLIVIVINLFTELASNSATAAAFLPIMGSVAIAIGQNPLLFAIPITLAATCAFMLPVATPPNAIVYSSGYLTIPQMVKAGFFLTISFTFLITLLAYYLFPLILGIEIGTVPEGLLP